MKKITLLFLIVIFFPGVFIFVVQDAEADSNIPFQDDFNFSWTYQKIFGPADIPLPASMNGAAGGNVKAIYSPSVVKYNNKYLMFFGVSLYCNPPGTVAARDSIALAESDNGINWRFVKYVIEPDSSVCFLPRSSWNQGAFYQANDPAVQISSDGSNLLVYYTSVLYDYPSSARECGNIGLAIFDGNLNLISNHTTFLSPSTSDGDCSGGYYGFSRPSIQMLSSAVARLWFDSSGIVGHIPVSNYNQLNTGDVFMEGFSGIDVNSPTLDYTKTLLLTNTSVINARSVLASGGWSNQWPFTVQSGQMWDSWYQASPDLLLDKNTCEVKLYLAGAVNDGTGWYSSINIGMALPPAGKIFSFPLCYTPSGTITGADCVITPGQTTCSTNITWSAQGVSSAYVHNASIPGSAGVVSANVSGTQTVIIDSIGTTFNLHQSVTNTILASVFVRGVYGTANVDPIGWHDFNNNATCSAIGWAYDPNVPAQSLDIHVYKDGPSGSGIFVGSYSANVFSQALNDALRPSYPNISGSHRFNITFPNSGASASLYDGSSHNLYFHAINRDANNQATGIHPLLGGTPQSIRCTIVSDTTPPAAPQGLSVQ